MKVFAPEGFQIGLVVVFVIPRVHGGHRRLVGVRREQGRGRRRGAHQAALAALAGTLHLGNGRLDIAIGRYAGHFGWDGRHHRAHRGGWVLVRDRVLQRVGRRNHRRWGISGQLSDFICGD